MSRENVFLGEVLQCAHENGVLQNISMNLSEECREAAIRYFLEKDNDNRDILNGLIIDINMKIHKQTLLLYAIDKVRVDLIDMLISRGIMVNPPYYIVAGEDIKHARHMVSPIFKAISSGNIDIVRMLLAAGADVNIQERKESLLYHAIEGVDSPCYDTIKEILCAGAKISEKDFGAAYYYDIETGTCQYTSLLLDYGYDLDEAGNYYKNNPSVDNKRFIKDLKERNPSYTDEYFSCT